MGSVKRLRDKVYRIVYDIPSTDGKRKQKRETLCNVTKPEPKKLLPSEKTRRSIPTPLRIPTSPSPSCLASSFKSNGGRCRRRLSNDTKASSTATSDRQSVTSK
jgi:hypothetical protein